MFLDISPSTENSLSLGWYSCRLYKQKRLIAVYLLGADSGNPQFFGPQSTFYFISVQKKD